MDPKLQLDEWLMERCWVNIYNRTVPPTIVYMASKLSREEVETVVDQIEEYILSPIMNYQEWYDYRYSYEMS